MNKTFMDTLCALHSMSDQKSMMFVDYVMKKYFTNQKETMLVSEAVPYLDTNDKEELEEIVNRAFYKAS